MGFSSLLMTSTWTPHCKVLKDVLRRLLSLWCQSLLRFCCRCMNTWTCPSPMIWPYGAHSWWLSMAYLEKLMLFLNLVQLILVKLWQETTSFLTGGTKWFTFMSLSVRQFSSANVICSSQYLPTPTLHWTFTGTWNFFSTLCLLPALLQPSASVHQDLSPTSCSPTASRIF